MNRRSSAKAGASSRSYRVGGFLSENRAELRSVCDIYDAHRDHLLKLLNAGEAVQSVSRHEDVLANPNVDAVILAVPDHLHFSIGQTVLQAENIFIWRSPQSIIGTSGPSLETAAEASGCVLQCGTQQSSGADYIRARHEIFAAGKLGQEVFARAVWSNFPWQCRHITPAPQPLGLDWKRFLGPPLKSRTTRPAMTRGAISPITAAVCRPTSSRIGPMSRNGCSTTTGRRLPTPAAEFTPITMAAKIRTP